LVLVNPVIGGDKGNANVHRVVEPSVYHNTEGHFSLIIPAGWEEIPKDAIETVLKSLKEDYDYTSPPQYGGGFHKLDTTYFSRPYILFGIDRSGRWSESQIEKFLSSNGWENTFEEVESELSKQLPGLIQKSKPGEATFDKPRNMVFIKSEEGVSVFILSNYGFVDLHCYSDKENFENDLPYFTQIIDSFRYDAGYGYNQITKDTSFFKNRSGPTVSVSELIELIVLIIFSAISSLLGAIFVQLATKIVAGFKPPYGTAYITTFISCCCVIACFIALPIISAGVNMGTVLILPLLVGFFTSSLLYGKKIRHPETGPIGFGKGMLITCFLAMACFLIFFTVGIVVPLLSK
jgi:hypothetical protein